ncbi:Zn-dependent peptidase ImmA (M78 family)/transcriptional regulator with XRE-family HTH domain [Massilia sp. UYP11]|uniref:helix-turn-helix domain-containing protein n=1 Tax=Massilia sp. UYP11 TaxID=1756385 RepID=UPI003D25FBD7
MSLNLAILGSKVAAYRQQLSDTVDEVAIATGVAGERIAAIEAGKCEPTGDEILILSDYFRCDYKVFLSNDAAAGSPPAQALYRAKNEDFNKDDRRAICDFLYLCETEHELANELGRLPKPFELPPATHVKRSAAEGVAAVRAHLGHRGQELPYDVFGDCRRLGIHVFRRRLGDSNISGLFIVHPVAGKCVLVNSSEDMYRQRFSAAHELAHALFDAGTVARVSLRSEGSNPLERHANAFASEYLMPTHLLRQLPKLSALSDDEIKRWANHFKVSCDALGVAAQRARIVDNQQSRRIRDLRVAAADKVDPEIPASLSETQRRQKSTLLDLGLSDHYVALCFDAHRNGLISAGRLAEALLLSHGELQEVAALYGRSLNGH